MGAHSQLAQSENCLAAPTLTSAKARFPCHTTNSTITATMSRVKQNFHQDTEALINKQINMELYASYVYKSMATYFAREDIALHGFAKRFREASKEESEHADKMIDYQTMRGGRVVFRDIAKPNRDDWGTALEAV